MTNLPILPTSIVGSYSMPGWLERLKSDYFARRISHHDLDEIYDAAAKAAIKDQETAGLDIITDGEPRRDNVVDYFLERLPGVQIDRSSKKFYYDFYDSSVLAKLPRASLGLVRDFQFLRDFTDRVTKISITGPHCLTKRLRNQFYPNDEALAMDIARVMNLELKALAKAGADIIQIDEPYYSGFPGRPAVGAEGFEHAGGWRGYEDCAARLLREPVWKTFVGGQLPLSFSGGSGCPYSATDARICAARGRGSGPVSGV